MISGTVGWGGSCVSAALAGLLQPDAEHGPGLPRQLVLSYSWLFSGHFGLSLTSGTDDAW